MSTFHGVADAYRRSFAALCAGTVDVLLDATDAGGELLDVVCGTGELAVAAVRRGRRVLAVDPDPGMVAHTRAAAPRARVREAGAPTLPLPDGSIGALTANFVVNHVPDPRATLRDLARVATPGAPVAMTIWPAEPGPHLRAHREAADAAGAVPVPSTRLPEHLDFTRSPDGLAGIAEEAGLRVQRAEELRWTWHVSGEDLLAGITGGVAGPGRLHLAQSAAVRADIEQRVRAAWDAYRGADGRLAFPVSAVLVVAESVRRPGACRHRPIP